LPPAQRDKHAERRRIATEKIGALGGLVPELTVRVPENAPADLVVKRNGTTVEATTYGIGRGVDPGDYEIVAELGGKRVYEHKFKLGERDRATVDVTLTRGGSAGPIGDEKKPAGESDGPTGLATAGYVVVGLGAASLAAGIVTGALAWSKKSTIEDSCVDRLCTQDGLDAVSAGQNMALASTITFVAGLVGLAAGTTMVLLGGNDEAADQASPAGPSASLEFVWSASAESSVFGLKGRY